MKRISFSFFLLSASIRLCFGETSIVGFGALGGRFDDFHDGKNVILSRTDLGLDPLDLLEVRLISLFVLISEERA